MLLPPALLAHLSQCPTDAMSPGEGTLPPCTLGLVLSSDDPRIGGWWPGPGSKWISRYSLGPADMALVGWKDVHHDEDAHAFVWIGLGSDTLSQGNQMFSVPVLLQLPGRVGQDMTGSYVKISVPCCVEHRPNQTTGST